MMTDPRDRVLELIEKGLLDPVDVLVMALKYMSWSNIIDMMRVNEIEEMLDPDYNPEDDDENA